MFEENIIPWTEKYFFISVWTKKYPLIITETTEKEPEEMVHIKCDWANINQTYRKEDLHLLFMDIAWMIENEQSQNKTSVFQFRLTPKQRMQLEKNAKANWYDNVSEFVKNRCLVNG